MSRATKPDPARRPYLGYRADDQETPFARYFTDTMGPLADHAADAVTVGAVAPPLLTALEDAPGLLDGDAAVENGLTVDVDGSIVVALRTPMPGVTPAMWDWWFGWHGSDARRYKLWHPRAHLYAQWDDGADDGRRGRDRYVGRSSFVDEYLGSTLAKACIRFVPPGELGFDEGRLRDETVICARTGSSQLPVDIGWLVHHVRPTDDGCEMRSRFWLGGRYAAPRAANPVLDRVVPPVANRALQLTDRSAADLLVHCAQEMGHLAGFLAELHAEFGDE